MHENSVTALIMAAGNSTRMKTELSKQLIPVCGRPVIAHTIEAFEKSAYIKDIIIVTRELDILAVKDIIDAFGFKKVTRVVTGGATRQDSVRCGLDEISSCDFVAIHDGARPCVTTMQINQTAEAAEKYGCAAIGCAVTDTLKFVRKGKIVSTVSRENLWQIQTPQIFRTEIILEAYNKAFETGINTTDDTALLEQLNIPVAVVEGDFSNIKVTKPGDILVADAILRTRKENC